LPFAKKVVLLQADSPTGNNHNNMVMKRIFRRQYETIISAAVCMPHLHGGQCPNPGIHPSACKMAQQAI
jgi:hypothetical protein